MSSEFTRRRARSQNYSLRAFARDIGLSPSQVCEILSGKRGLTSTKAAGVATRLLLNQAERELFELSVVANHDRSIKKRKLAITDLKKRSRSSKIALESFKVISDWYHVAILEYLRIENASPNYKDIADVIGISHQECKDALARLIKLGLVTINGGIPKKKNANMVTGEDIPSSAIRNFHRQIMSRAERSLDDVAVEERDFQSVVVSFPRSEIIEFKKMIRDFVDAINDRAESYGARDEIYSISIQMVPLTKKRNKLWRGKNE